MLASSSIMYASQPGISLTPCFFAALKASGKACTTPWSVTAMALCPQAAACLIRSVAVAQASIVL